jgi:prepilin-type N-terminal cleavage/methylation domain-containing protein
MNTKLKKYKAFTLAEILITLLIIGVIASIVVPPIINDTQQTEYITSYKKAYAMGLLAVKSGLRDYSYFDRTGTYDLDATQNDWNTFKSFFSVQKECNNNNNDQCWDATGEKMESPALRPYQREQAFIDNSGMAWSIYNMNENIILVDTNGFNTPNRYGKDRWHFTFKDANNNRQTTGYPVKFGPYWNSDITGVHSFLCHYPPCYFKSWLMQ